MIHAHYKVDEAKNHMTIQVYNKAPKLPLEGYKPADATFHLENAIGKYYKLSKAQSDFAVDIVIQQDSPYLHAIAQLVRNYCRGIYNEITVTIANA